MNSAQVSFELFGGDIFQRIIFSLRKMLSFLVVLVNDMILNICFKMLHSASFFKAQIPCANFQIFQDIGLAFWMQILLKRLLTVSANAGILKNTQQLFRSYVSEDMFAFYR